MYYLCQTQFGEAGSPYHKLESVVRHSFYELPVAYSMLNHPGSRPYELAAWLAPGLSYRESAGREESAAAGREYKLFPPVHAEYHFHPEEFLRSGREGRFIGRAEEIKEYIVEAFERIFKAPFPDNITITVAKEQEFRKIAPHPGTVGLSMNRRKEGLVSEIFVLNDTLAKVMLTIGHELGHVLTPALDNPHDEEAKAYAFSLVWIKAIKEYNLAGLAGAVVTEKPAENGLHNVAFSFVDKMLRQGMESWQLYVGLIRNTISMMTA